MGSFHAANRFATLPRIAATRRRWTRSLLLFAFAVTPNCPVAAQSDLAADASTRYVLLRTDRVLMGQVTSESRAVLVTRNGQSELRLPAEQVVATAASPSELFELRQRWLRRVPGHPKLSECLDDARWCIENDYPAEATRQLLTIYEHLPDHPQAKQLEARLRNHSNRTPIETDRREATAPLSTTIRQVTYESEFIGETKPPEPDAWTLHTFAATIQPILIAKCGRCHDANSVVRSHSPVDGSHHWQLSLPGGGVRPSTRITRENLRETLRWITPGQSGACDWIRRSGEVHWPVGESDPAPITQYEARLTETLRAWVDRLPTDLDAARNEPAMVQPITTTSPIEPAPTTLIQPAMDDSPQPSTTRRLPPVEPIDSVSRFNRQTELIEAIDWSTRPRR